jgi:hypothetical protein
MWASSSAAKAAGSSCTGIYLFIWFNILAWESDELKSGLVHAMRVWCPRARPVRERAYIAKEVSPSTYIDAGPPW